MRRRPQYRPVDLADFACVSGALLIALVLSFIAWGSMTIHVTDHALLRYIGLTEHIDVEQLRSSAGRSVPPRAGRGRPDRRRRLSRPPRRL